ncbi:MAG: hypothetical protein KJ771_02700, partial [Nanoarchaeota archaeon]|nr:hypothetical protein [Nanoarchaeota archaeon]
MIKKILNILVILILTFTTVFSALAEDNLLNTNWVDNGGNSLTVTQGEDATLHLEILSAGNTVYLQVRLYDQNENFIKYIEENFPVYSSGTWEGDLTINTADLLNGYFLQVEVLNWNGVGDEETLYLHVEEPEQPDQPQPTTNHAPTLEITPEATETVFPFRSTLTKKQAPVPAYRFTINEPVLIYANGEDQDNDVLTYNQAEIQTDLPNGLTTVPQNYDDLWISGRAQETGTYFVDVTVSDGEFDITKKIAIIIEEQENVAPVMDEVDNVNINEGELLNLQATATDANDDQLTYEVEVKKRVWLFFNVYSSVLLDEMTFNQETGEFTFAPDFDFVSLGSKDVELRFRAFDNEEYSDWEESTVTVNDVIVEEVIFGCTDPLATNYNLLADIDDGSCEYPIVSPEICDNGLDDDGDGLVDCQDPDCQNNPVCEVVNPVQESIYENVKIKSVHLSNEVLSAGDYLSLNVHLFNNGDEELEDLKVRV